MRAKAFVFNRGNAWHYIVRDKHGRYVLSDNTRDWRKMFDAAYLDAAAIRRIESAGHKLQYTYPELVDRA